MQVLETQIDDTHKSLDSLAAVSKRLSDTGVKLQSDIAGNQAELARLRAAYLKEIKQMRLHRAQTTGMAFSSPPRTSTRAWRVCATCAA